LSGRLKLSEYRQNSLNDVEAATAQLLALFGNAISDRAIQEVEKSHVDKRELLASIELANTIIIKTRISSENSTKFMSCLDRCIDKFIIGKDVSSEDGQPLPELRNICKVIIDSEWARIERELKGLS